MKFRVAASHILKDPRAACWIVSGYALLGTGWIALSRFLPRLFASDPASLARYELGLDILLFLLTTFSLAFFLRRVFRILWEQEDEMLRMVESVCSATGESFFPTLVKGLSGAVEADYAFIAEFTDESRRSVRTVAACCCGGIIDNFEFDLEGTPCSEVVGGGKRSFPKGVREIFPNDPVAEELEVESYVGIPLIDSSGRVLGPMAVFSRKPLPDARLAGSMLQLFAVRASAELERLKAEETIEHMACFDSLTGLPNRRMFCDTLNQEMHEAKRCGAGLAVIFVDLDQLKKVNDTLGHAAGDRLLKEAGQRLCLSLRRQDSVARLSGDEFMLCLPGMCREEEVAAFATEILSVLQEPFRFEGHELHVNSSIGIAVYPDSGETAETLMRNADTAMNRAKDLGRNNFQHYSSQMTANSLSRLGLEAQLRKAVEGGELRLHYQPQYDLESGRIVGGEALLRWEHPERGLVHPDEFIPLAEETGLILPIGRWVIDEACRQSVAWQGAGLEPVRIAVNLSARQFLQSDLPRVVESVLGEVGLDPDLLELEITETTIMEDLEKTIEQLLRLKELGVKISIDDFGTGYSSLNYLKKFPLDVLKIDRSFVKDIGGDCDDTTIVNAIISLAHNLKLQVVAEGVETREQVDFLRARGCDRVQGYYFSRPVPAGEFGALLGDASRRRAVVA